MFTLIWLAILLSRIILRQKDKNNVKSIYFIIETYNKLNKIKIFEMYDILVRFYVGSFSVLNNLSCKFKFGRLCLVLRLEIAKV